MSDFVRGMLLGGGITALLFIGVAVFEALAMNNEDEEFDK